jgi:NADH-quinone oxidoreductase subunit L
VPFLSGFFSKDEILYETFHEGHTILWLVGAITSFLTATYMFRLVFLTFHGKRRHDAPAPEHPEEEESASHHGGADSHLHDAPPAMAFALIVLAVGSVLAGYIGVPHVLGGHNQLAAWLAPSFQATALPEEAEIPAGEAALEFTLMGVSSAIAIGGILLAAFIWLKRRSIADALALRFGGLHRLLLNKYYVDEVYDATVVRPIHVASREALWRGFDVRVVDGAVNGTAAIVSAGSSVLRRLQTGSVRAYASSMFVGVVVILGYYLWR